MAKPSLAILIVALSFALAACRGAEEPQITHWYGGTAVTTGACTRIRPGIRCPATSDGG